jgi:hypothetical protein
MKTRYEFDVSFYWGERVYNGTGMGHQSKIIKSPSESLDRFPGVGASGRRDVEEEGAVGAKT